MRPLQTAKLTKGSLFVRDSLSNIAPGRNLLQRRVKDSSISSSDAQFRSVRLASLHSPELTLNRAVLLIPILLR